MTDSANGMNLWQSRKREQEKIERVRRELKILGDMALSHAVSDFLNLKTDGYVISVYNLQDPEYIRAVINKKITNMDKRFRWSKNG